MMGLGVVCYGAKGEGTCGRTFGTIRPEGAEGTRDAAVRDHELVESGERYSALI